MLGLRRLMSNWSIYLHCLLKRLQGRKLWQGEIAVAGVALLQGMMCMCVEGDRNTIRTDRTMFSF